MVLNNRDRVGKVLQLLSDGLAGPVDQVMRKAFGGRADWNEVWAARDAQNQQRRKAMTYSKTDVQVLLRAVTEYGKHFSTVLSRPQQAYAAELREIRNDWAHSEPISEEDADRALDTAERLLMAVGASELAGEVRRLRSDVSRVVVGRCAEVGSGYQRRGFDDAIEALWVDGGDRRVWLRGAPGLGKSFAARRVMQEALAYQGEDREELLVWVDSADAASLVTVLSTAVDRMPQLGLTLAKEVPDREHRQAERLLEALVNSTWAWLIVLDNADANSLIESGVLPPGGNPNGRVLITTLSQDQRLGSNGRVVVADLFTTEEAVAYLRTRTDTRDGGLSALAKASEDEHTALVEAVDHHPLALSIAAATIVANSMDMAEWIREFNTSELMDAAADEPDAGGYPHTMAATWQVALDKASQGLPEGVVERAAAVAAVQDPDGHPTWLWKRDGVVNWVAGDTVLARSHGQPLAVQRLIEHGILTLIGDSWRDGQLAIHQLAARAVRELAQKGSLAALGEILLDEWLLEVTESRYGVRQRRQTIQSLASIPGLPATAQVTAEALLGFIGPDDAASECLDAEEDYRIIADLADRNVALFRNEGARTGMVASAIRAGLDTEYWRLSADIEQRLTEIEELADDDRARCFFHLGQSLSSLERSGEAKESYEQAASIYKRIVAQEDDEVKLAGYLTELGKVQKSLDLHDETEASRSQAADLYRYLTNSEDVNDRQRARWLSELAELLDHLGLPEERDEVLSRERAVLWHGNLTTENRPVDCSDTLYRARRLQLLGMKYLPYMSAQPEQRDQAREDFARAAELYRMSNQPGWESGVKSSLHHRLDLQLHSLRWHDAEISLNQLLGAQDLDLVGHERADDLVLLASVKRHLDRSADIHDELACATDLYRAANRADHQHPRLRSAFKRQEWAERLSADEEWEEAARLFADAAQLLQNHAQENPGDHEQDLATVLWYLGHARSALNQWDEAEDALIRSTNIDQLLCDMGPEDQEALTRLSSGLLLLSVVQPRLDKAEDAIQTASRAIDVSRRRIAMDPSDPSARDQLACIAGHLGGLLADAGRLEEAAVFHEQTVASRDELLKRDPCDHKAMGDLADALAALGIRLEQTGQYGEAERAYSRALDIRRTLAEADVGDREAQAQLAGALFQLGRFFYVVGRLDEGNAELVRSVNTSRMLVGLDADDRESQERLDRSLLILAWMHLSDHPDETVTYATELADRHQVMLETDSANGMSAEIDALQVKLATALLMLGGGLHTLARHEEAIPVLTRAIQLSETHTESAGDEHEDARRILIVALKQLSECLQSLGRSSEANEASTRAWKLAQEWFPEFVQEWFPDWGTRSEEDE